MDSEAFRASQRIVLSHYTRLPSFLGPFQSIIFVCFILLYMARDSTYTLRRQVHDIVRNISWDKTFDRFVGGGLIISSPP